MLVRETAIRDNPRTHFHLGLGMNRSTSLAALVSVTLPLLATQTALAAEPGPATAATIDAWASELSNAGRWGDDDQLGTLNLITPATRVAAARLVTEGFSVSMAHPLLTEAAADNTSPFEHNMQATPAEAGGWATDTWGLMFHGFGHSHIDALCHLAHKGKYYNGFEMAETTAAGCKNLGIANIGNGIFTRGVLMDIPRLKGKDWLEPAQAVHVADLEAWEERAGVKVGAGDAVLLHTGRWLRRAAKGPHEGGYPGFHASVVPWLKERDVAVIGTDGGLDVYPSGIEGAGAPVHTLVLTALGMPILDVMDLTDVAAASADRKRWTFLLTAAPMRVRTGTGSPINSIATF